MFSGVLGRPVCVCAVPEIMTNLFFMLRDFLEFLEDLHQLIGILGIECCDAQLPPGRYKNHVPQSLEAPR
jgi:hypothetical protein